MPDLGGAGAPRKALGPEIIIPLLSIGFVLYYFLTVWDLSWEAKADGLAVGAILLALVVVFLVKAGLQVARGHATLAMSPLLNPSRIQGQRLLLIAATVVFIVVLPHLGFTVALFLFLIATMRILGVRRPTSLLAVAGSVAGGGYLLFIAFLNTRFPRGPFEQLLKWLF